MYSLRRATSLLRKAHAQLLALNMQGSMPAELNLLINKLRRNSRRLNYRLRYTLDTVRVIDGNNNTMAIISYTEEDGFSVSRGDREQPATVSCVSMDQALDRVYKLVSPHH
jgi:hypothetical protein